MDRRCGLGPRWGRGRNFSHCLMVVSALSGRRCPPRRAKPILQELKRGTRSLGSRTQAACVFWPQQPARTPCALRGSSRFSRHSPDSRVVERDFPSHRGAPQRNSIATASVRSQIVGLPASQCWNSLLCLHQGASLPSPSVASDPIFVAVSGSTSPNRWVSRKSLIWDQAGEASGLPFSTTIGDRNLRLLVTVLAAGMGRFGRHLEGIS
jgi:hypothetical protein